MRKILLEHPVDKAVNRSSMMNPAALDWFIAFAAARRAEQQARYVCYFGDLGRQPVATKKYPILKITIE